ncbi:MAG: hypothetical protein N3C12_13820 [Candidatus Binatia bacterium]|nr:hypothetical protein [Candidatus Binatia bacterium]
MKSLPPDYAQGLFGKNFYGPAEVEQAFGTSAGPVPHVPFDQSTLRSAAESGLLLILRQPALGGSPFVLERAIASHEDLFDARFLRQVGYQLKDEWGILLEPVAKTETPRPGWALVSRSTLPATRNRSYHEQTKILENWGKPWNCSGLEVGRRLAAEIVYDCILVFRSRGERLLEREWDWSATATVDGGYVNVGGFGPKGMQIFSYSAAVRHSWLGVCPQIRGCLEGE